MENYYKYQVEQNEGRAKVLVTRGRCLVMSSDFSNGRQKKKKYSLIILQHL